MEKSILIFFLHWNSDYDFYSIFVIIGVGDGTLRCIQGSHRFHKEFLEAFKDELPNKDKNWHVLTEKQLQWLKDRGCEELCIVVPAGYQVRGHP